MKGRSERRDDRHLLGNRELGDSLLAQVAGGHHAVELLLDGRAQLQDGVGLPREEGLLLIVERAQKGPVFHEFLAKLDDDDFPVGGH
jgi:hypothetical protein